MVAGMLQMVSEPSYNTRAFIWANKMNQD